MLFHMKNPGDEDSAMALCRGIAKTVNRKWTLKMKVVTWGLMVLLVYLSLPIGGRRVDGMLMLTAWIGMGLLVFTQIYGDSINAKFAISRKMPGTQACRLAFHEDGITVSAELVEQRFAYAAILYAAEWKDYFVFILSEQQSQVCAKDTLEGGTVEEFRVFFRDKAGKEILAIK